MAWTPGLTLDYARALSMLADPRPAGWITTIRRAINKIFTLHKQWHDEKSQGMRAPTVSNVPPKDKGK
jgi:hypothetical protein